MPHGLDAFARAAQAAPEGHGVARGVECELRRAEIRASGRDVLDRAPGGATRTGRALDDVGPAVEAQPRGDGVSARIDRDLRLEGVGSRPRKRLRWSPAGACVADRRLHSPARGVERPDGDGVTGGVDAHLRPLGVPAGRESLGRAPRAGSRARRGPDDRGVAVGALPDRDAVSVGVQGDVRPIDVETWARDVFGSQPRSTRSLQRGLHDHVRSVRARPDGQCISGSVQRDLRNVGVLAGSREVVQRAPAPSRRARAGLNDRVPSLRTLPDDDRPSRRVHGEPHGVRAEAVARERLSGAPGSAGRPLGRLDSARARPGGERVPARVDCDVQVAAVSRDGEIFRRQPGRRGCRTLR